MNPPWYAIPFAIPPIACSRTPNRRLRPGSSASNEPSPLTSVRLDSDRSAAPPNRRGSGFARAWITSWLALRVATSTPSAYVGSPASQPSGRRPSITRRRKAAATSGWSSAYASNARSQASTMALPAGTARAEELERLGRLVEGLVGIPAVVLLDEPDLVLAERLAVRLLGVLAVRAAEADVGPDRDQATVAGRPGRPRSRAAIASMSLPSSTRWVCQPYASNRATTSSDQAIDVGPSSWMWLSS